MSIFLSEDELVELTKKKAKGKQIEALRFMAIPFRVTVTGHPVVTRAAVIGAKEVAPPAKPAWVPRVLKAG